MFTPHEIENAVSLVVISEHCSEAHLAGITFTYLLCCVGRQRYIDFLSSTIFVD